MSGTTNSNGRDGNAWVEGLLTGAGASIGRVLDERQVHAANLAIEVFAYLLAALPADRGRLPPGRRGLKLAVARANGLRSGRRLPPGRRGLKRNIMSNAGWTHVSPSPRKAWIETSRGAGTMS